MDESTLPGEVWLPVPGYEENYQVSNLGRIIARVRQGSKGGIRKPQVDKNGYLVLFLCQNGQRSYQKVHILAALAFLGPRPEGAQVRHLDGNPANCTVDNLAYGTPSDNGHDAVRHGRNHNAVKTHCKRGHKYTEENIYRLPSQPNRRYCRACHNLYSRERYQRKSKN